MAQRTTLADDVLALLRQAVMRPGEVAARLGRDRTQVAKVLRGLLDAGLVEQADPPAGASTDGRGRWYRASEGRVVDLDELRSQRSRIEACARRHHGRRVRVFGSVARGEARPGSDVDLLVDFDEHASLFDQVRLVEALERLLGTSVDVVSAGGLKARDDDVRREAVEL